jgi:alpha-glucosidase
MNSFSQFLLINDLQELFSGPSLVYRFVLIFQTPILTILFYLYRLRIFEFMEENKTTTNEHDEHHPDFSGNYIQNFQQAVEGQYFPGSLISWEKKDQVLYFHAENTTLELVILTDDIIRFRYGNFGIFENDFSYAMDPAFKASYPFYEIVESKKTIVVKTSLVRCYIDRATLKTKIKDVHGHMILEDEKGYHWEDEPTYGGDIVISTKRLHGNENFYGLGDKSGKQNLKFTRKQMWGTDCYGYGNDTDPLYKNIPFYLGLNNKIGYGVFFDNSFRTFYDFGKERKNAMSFWAQGGEMRYYFIYGPTLKSVAEKYTLLTGRPELPPKWSLGYHQSKWSYYPEKVVRDLAAEFRKREIPCDVIHLDIDYMDGFRCFTWDKSRFPDPETMIADLKKDGFKTVVINDPGIKIDHNYWVYQEGIRNDYFCKRTDGPLFKGSVWPGLCHFPDFTKPEVRDWWAGLYKDLLSTGIDGVWNDMNEPAVFEEGTFPIDVRHDYDGHPCSHRKAHNVYGLQMSRASYMGQKKNFEGKRVFNITRSAFAGIQRYASVWTGDNLATWEHLSIANVQCQRLSESGVSFVGSDVGGFIGSPEPELYTRWIQMAVFHPFFRTHSSGDHGDKEPWLFDDKYTKIVKKYIELRYELIPYIYSAFWIYSNFGTPMLQSLHLYDQEDDQNYFREDEFLLGDNILVCPVLHQGAKGRTLYLPSGTWYDFWNDQKVEGKQEMSVMTPLSTIPIYIRAGSVIPLQPSMQYIDEFEFEVLSLHVFFGENENESILYEDKGDGHEYQSGDSCIRKFRTGIRNNEYVIRQEIEGTYDSSYSKFELVLHGFDQPAGLYIDGQEFTSRLSKDKKHLRLEVDKNFSELYVKFNK